MAAPKSTPSILVGFTLDFETGSLQCRTGAITQIALHATRLDTFECLGTYVMYAAPYRRKEIKGVDTKRKTLKSKYETADDAPMMDYEDKALEYSDISIEKLEQQGVDIDVIANDVLKFITDHTPTKCSRNLRPFLIGQNIDFDKGFFMQLMERAGLVKEVAKYLRGHEDFYGHWQPDTLDTLMLGQLALCHKPDISSYKLEIMCENLGIELDDAHDADADVTATTNVVAVLTQKMRNGIAGPDSDIALAKAEKTRKHFKI